MNELNKDGLAEGDVFWRRTKWSPCMEPVRCRVTDVSGSKIVYDIEDAKDADWRSDWIRVTDDDIPFYESELDCWSAIVSAATTQLVIAKDAHQSAVDGQSNCALRAEAARSV
jgi:hypothetical protein